MRLALVFLCFAVVLGFAAEECANCAAFAGRPHAAIMTSVDEVAQTLSAYVFYENTTASPPRQPVNDSIIVLEISNASFREIYKTYTGPAGNMTFNFSSWAQTGCINIKVLYCPFCSPDSEAPCFLQCIQYAGLSNNKTYYMRPDNSYQFSSTERTARPLIDNVSDIPDVPGASPPSAINPEKYFPDLRTVSYCAPPPPMNATPAMCFPLLIIFSLLGGALYLTGRNPFMSFNIGSQHVGRHIRYQARGRGVSISGQAIAGAVSSIKGAKDAKKQGVADAKAKAKAERRTLTAKEERAAGRQALSQMESGRARMSNPIGQFHRIGAGFAAMRQSFADAKGKGFKEGIATFSRQMQGKMGGGGGGGAIATKDLFLQKSEGGSRGFRMADVFGGMKDIKITSAKDFFNLKNLGSYYGGVAQGLLKIGGGILKQSNFGMLISAFGMISPKTAKAFDDWLVDNKARAKEDVQAMNDRVVPGGGVRVFVGAKVDSAGQVISAGNEAIMKSERTADGKLVVTFTAPPGENLGKIDGKAAIASITMTLGPKGVESTSAFVVAAKDFGSFTKGEALPATMVVGQDGKTRLDIAPGAAGVNDLKGIAMKDFQVVPAQAVSAFSENQRYMNKLADDTVVSLNAQKESNIATGASAVAEDPKARELLSSGQSNMSNSSLALIGATPEQFGTVDVSVGYKPPAGETRPEVIAVAKTVDALEHASVTNPAKLGDAIGNDVMKEFAPLVKSKELSSSERDVLKASISSSISTTFANSYGNMTLKEIADLSSPGKTLDGNQAAGVFMEAVSKGVVDAVSKNPNLTPEQREQKVETILSHLDEKQIRESVADLSNGAKDAMDAMRKQGLPDGFAKQVENTEISRLMNVVETGNIIRDSSKVSTYKDEDGTQHISYKNPDAVMGILSQNPEAIHLEGKAGDMLRENEHLQNEVWRVGKMKESVAAGSTSEFTDRLAVVNAGFSDYASTSMLQEARQERSWEKDIKANMPDVDKNVFSAIVNSAEYARFERTSDGLSLKPDPNVASAIANGESVFRENLSTAIQNGDFKGASDGAMARADEFRKQDNFYAANYYENLAVKITAEGQVASGPNKDMVLDGATGLKMGDMAKENAAAAVATLPDGNRMAQMGAITHHEQEAQEIFRQNLSFDDPSKANFRAAEGNAVEQINFYKNIGDENGAKAWENSLSLLSDLKRGRVGDQELPPPNTDEGKKAYQAAYEAIHENVGWTFQNAAQNQERIPDLERQTWKALGSAAMDVQTFLSKKDKYANVTENFIKGSRGGTPQ